MEQIATYYLDDYKHLDGAGMYEHNLTLSMVQAFSEANEGDEDCAAAHHFRRNLSNS